MKNIFILDTNTISSNLIKKELEQLYMYRVTCFNKQQDFLIALAQYPEIIIVDPEIKSLNNDFISFFKKITDTVPSSKIILFSNLSNLKLGIELIRKGAVDYINKKDEFYLKEIKNSIQIISKIEENNQRIEDVNQKLNSLKKNITIYAITTIILMSLFYFL